jgi:hypothetical protein
MKNNDIDTNTQFEDQLDTLHVSYDTRDKKKISYQGLLAQKFIHTYDKYVFY